ncbi:MAG: hypothetical protein LBQ06_01015, partial [Frankiaceae bacterium]|nr:hypothetical protein [Frankiaceae bacterium]
MTESSERARLDLDEVRDWIAGDVDPRAAAELEALLGAARSGDAGAAAELAERFRAPLAFGTAG